MSCLVGVFIILGACLIFNPNPQDFFVGYFTLLIIQITLKEMNK